MTTTEIRLEDVIEKYPKLFSNKKNKRELFISRGKTYIIEESQLSSRRAYQVIQVKDDLTLKSGKHYSSIEEVEATYAVQINF